ncbi:MAG: hypothetical protein WAW85_04955 [Gordonia sp. (in: high G+C Gram-positive bacteria)]|uniref:hypothetical protein n=1 Tax=Gordonia sp. (in: high G+C Gram-positive bacteria) TaxID=84139 RepID=UPI003BB80E8D
MGESEGSVGATAARKARETEHAERRLGEQLSAQHGVITRSQVLECGFVAQDVRRLLRSTLTKVCPGVYVNHNGPLSWYQRAWTAVLAAYPAALSHRSAVEPGHGGAIHIVVARHRSIGRRAGVVVHYGSHLAERVRWAGSPPRVRAEHAALDTARDAATDSDAVAALCGVLNDHRTTADRTLTALQSRPRIRRHGMIEAVLTDFRDGACSLLESRYLHDVERAHGLPVPARQAPTRVGRKGFRDIDYDDWGVVVELDGRYGHEDPVSRARDLERDLDAAVSAHKVTLRLGAVQVFDRPCSTARKVGALLAQRGWPGTPTRCPACAPATQSTP